MPAAMAPDCEISARFPATGMCAEKLALRPTPGIIMPRQLGPISRMPYLRAARSQASAIDPAPCPSPAVMISAPAMPSFPASSMISATARAGAVITTSSGTNGKSPSCATVVNAIDLRVTRIHQAEPALKIRLADIAENGTANRTRPRTCAHQRDGLRQKQIFQTIGRHRLNYNPGRWPADDNMDGPARSHLISRKPNG